MSLTFTGETAFDVVANNDVVNAMLCTVSKEMMVVNDRVSDSLGGTCGAPSPLVHNSAPAAAAVESSESATATAEAEASVEASVEASAADSAAEASSTARRL